MNHYPLFADLNGRPVLLAGAGKVAERKAESLLQAGAAVRVVARELNPVFQKWADEGKIEWLGSEFHEDDLDDVFFAVAATDDYAFNRRIFQAAEQRAKLCNTVDTADLCSFTVPAVIDRSPLKIAVSSGATAPVLARKWRQIIETLIPLHTGQMAALAGKWRNAVKAKIKGTANRRRFWETCSTAVLTRSPPKAISTPPKQNLPRSLTVSARQKAKSSWSAQVPATQGCLPCTLCRRYRRRISCSTTLWFQTTS